MNRFIARLVAYCLLALLPFASMPAYAGFTPPTLSGFNANYGGNVYGGKTIADACTAAAAAKHDTYTGMENGYCVYAKVGYGVVGPGDYQAACPENSVIGQNSQCFCIDGYEEFGSGNFTSCKKIGGSPPDPPTLCVAGTTLVDGVCVSLCAKAKGTSAGIWNIDTGIGAGGAAGGFKRVCTQLTTTSCMLMGESTACGMYGTGKSYVCSVPMTYTGDKCTPDNTASPNAGDNATDIAPPINDKVNNDKEGNGKCPGEVNGVTVYVKCTTVQSGSKVDTVKSDGEKVTVKEDVVCTVNQCTITTTTTTITNTGSTSVSGSTKSGSKDEICKGSTAAACTGIVSSGDSDTGTGDGKTSSFGGACKAGFTCDGDAAMCAIAKAANDSKCRLFDLTDSEDTVNLDLGKALAAGTDTSVKDPKTAAGGMQSIAMSKLENVANPYGETCPSDIPISAMGKTFMIPIADKCNVLRILGNIFWASTIFATSVFVLKGAA